MKTFLLILGVALFIIGFQDGVRILADSSQYSIFAFLPGGLSLYIGLDVAICVGGALLAKRAYKHA